MKRMKRNQRIGAAVVEFAFVAPIFVLLVFGIIEFGRGMMVQQIITNATREGAREAALPDATMNSVQSKVVEFLADSSIKISADAVLVTPDPAEAFNNEQIDVSVSVPFSKVSWIPGDFLGSATLRASTKMRSERLN